MGINGTLGIPLSWIYAGVYVALFYVMKAMRTRKQDHWTDYFRFIIPSLILSAILWALIGFRFHLTTTNILWEMLFIFLLLSMMYLYVDSLMTGAATLARLTYTTNFDELTHVNNYFAFKNDFEEQFAHSRTTDQPLTLMLFDIDHFKQVNDTYGHLAGDYVLSHTAQLVTKQLGELDDTLHLYRTGGEEFTILFTGYTTEQAAPLVHSIAQRVREAHFSHDGHQISISISAGVTQLHTDDDQRVDIFHRADRNLYHSKQTGRDRVTIQ
ncbi:GGDEF domain-containing protein [Levilactobacillus brevis]|nr:GGDEF domain-containing protein [Levilactobacillus brevis]